jgi:hypothetical protein
LLGDQAIEKNKLVLPINRWLHYTKKKKESFGVESIRKKKE